MGFLGKHVSFAFSRFGTKMASILYTFLTLNQCYLDEERFQKVILTMLERMDAFAKNKVLLLAKVTDGRSIRTMSVRP